MPVVLGRTNLVGGSMVYLWLIMVNLWFIYGLSMINLSGWWCNVPILKNDGVRQWEG